MPIFKREKRNKYAKIPKKNKILFLKKVIQQKQPLKLTADLFKINYSTAKTLIRQFRTDNLDLDLTECEQNDSNNLLQNAQGLKRCTFKVLNFNQKQPEPSLIPCLNDLKQNSDKNKVEKIGYILTWPRNQGKNNGIQIISKIQFQ